MNQKDKENEFELNEPINQIVVPKEESDSALKEGYDYIWGSDQDELVKNRET